MFAHPNGEIRLVKMVVTGGLPATANRMTLNDRSTPLSLLETRRSGSPREMVGPGPSQAELRQMLEIATRTPDHGRLVPYRFVTVATEQRGDLEALYARALRIADPDASETKVAKSVANAHAAPTLVVLIFSPRSDHKIPPFEQELTCGAVGMNLLHAAHALGFVGGWITGWPAYDPTVAAAFCEKSERIAGFFYFGQPGSPLVERDRPSLDSISSSWQP